MGTDDPCQESRRFLRIDAAFKAGDLAALRAELDDDEGRFPNVVVAAGIGDCLTYAVYHSPVAFIAELLDLGADPNCPAGDGFPPVIAALSCATSAPGSPARTDVHQIVELLLARGSDVQQRGLNDYTPLHWAAGVGDLAMVDLLLAHGADPNEITRIDDMETPLVVASVAGHTAIVDRLRPLTTRLDWEAASRTGDVKVLARMVRSGHAIDARDGYGQTALMRAAHAGHADAVDWLIDHGADLDYTSKFHLSALMLAIIAGHPRVARRLVAAGADTTITGTGAPGFHGKTAADLASERGDKRLAAYISARRPG
ncbi:MAG TPA: ankyrin repeat domain-containing protein [Ilumatobacter sp.]